MWSALLFGDNKGLTEGGKANSTEDACHCQKELLCELQFGLMIVNFTHFSNQSKLVVKKVSLSLWSTYLQMSRSMLLGGGEHHQKELLSEWQFGLMIVNFPHFSNQSKLVVNKVSLFLRSTYLQMSRSMFLGGGGWQYVCQKDAANKNHFDLTIGRGLKTIGV